jgi:hypothetical protein
MMNTNYLFLEVYWGKYMGLIKIIIIDRKRKFYTEDFMIFSQMKDMMGWACSMEVWMTVEGKLIENSYVEDSDMGDSIIEKWILG